MVRLSVLYPATPGSRFDWDYYVSRHVELVHRLLDPLGLIRLEIDRGIAGFPPGSPAPYQAIGHLFFPTIEALQAALGATVFDLIADQQQYTDVQVQVQISEVV
jgi:uncharacterized protein (TIGR02118 family)